MFGTPKDARGEDYAHKQLEAAEERARANIAAHEATLAGKIASWLPHLMRLPADSPQAVTLRQTIKVVAGQWRDYVEVEAREPKGDAIGLDFAAASLGTDRAGLERLIEWGLLARCRVNVGEVVLRREVEALQRDTTWWRPLLTLEP